MKASDVQLDWDWTPGPTEADFRDYTFGPWSSGDKEVSRTSAETESTESFAEEWVPFNLPKPRNYRLTTPLNPSQVNWITRSGPRSIKPSGNIAVQPGFVGCPKSPSQIYSNRVYRGFRLAGSLENSRYLFAYSNLTGRWDKTWMIERQGVTQGIENNQTYVRTHIHLLRCQWKYALDEVRVGCRGLPMDRNTPLSTDAFNLTKPTQFTGQAGALVAYVFDNTRERMMNIPEGTRYRIWRSTTSTPTNRRPHSAP